MANKSAKLLTVADLHALEPLLPDTRAVEPLVLDLTRETAALASEVPSPLDRSITELLRNINSYHSNLIEGHDTRPRDILRAMQGDLSQQPEQRALQLEARAHVEVQRLMEARLAQEPAADPTHPDMLRWIHREFYERVPKDYRVVRSPGGRESLVVPGEWRDEDVTVGRHAPPAATELPLLLARFHEIYGNRRLTGIERVAAIPASHHRLLWIHPFLDGNGRVARLYTDACLRRAQLGAHGLWTASRGLARQRKRYLALLEAADAERWDDYDGRGGRSARALNEWCVFFLETCLDQVRYMRQLLDPDELIARLRVWNATLAARGELPDEAWRVLAEIVRRGQLPRGEASRALGTSERTARRVIGALATVGAVTSDTPKGTLLLAIPVSALEAWFPALAPS